MSDLTDVTVLVAELSEKAAAIAALEAEVVHWKNAADMRNEDVLCLEAEVGRLRAIANRRADRIYGDLRPREELLRRAGIALAKRISEVTGACPYPIDDEACSLDCPPRGERMMCWAKWATEQACPAFVGCAGDCFDCDYAGTAREDGGDE